MSHEEEIARRRREARAREFANQVNRAREHLIEQELIGFTEALEGRVPSDEEIVKHGIWAKFSKTPLTVYEKDHLGFHEYFCWRRKHAIAVGFFQSDPTVLSVARLPDDKWPSALRLYVDQYPEQPTQLPPQ